MTSNSIRMSHLQGNYMGGNLALTFKSQRSSNAHSRATSQDGPAFLKAIKNENATQGRATIGAVIPQKREQPQLFKVKQITTASRSRESSFHNQFMQRAAPVVS